jgi:cell division protein FtsN
MIRSKHGEMTFSARQVAILLISAVAIAGVTFAIGFLSKGKETSQAPAIALKPDVDTPASPGGVTQKLDTDAILKEREIGKSAVPVGQFTFQKTLMQDTGPAKEPAPAVQAPPAEPPKVEKKEPQGAPADKKPAEQKIAGKKQAQEKKPAGPAPKENPRHDTQPATAKPSATPGKMFTLQVASFSAKTDAEKLVAQLAARRFMANIQEFKDKGATWYRVRVGVYKTEQAAIRDLGRLKADGTTKAFVTGY